MDKMYIITIGDTDKAKDIHHSCHESQKELSHTHSVLVIVYYCDSTEFCGVNYTP